MCYELKTLEDKFNCLFKNQLEGYQLKLIGIDKILNLKVIGYHASDKNIHAYNYNDNNIKGYRLDEIEYIKNIETTLTKDDIILLEKSNLLKKDYYIHILKFEKNI